jgi:hypothetical protein
MKKLVALALIAATSVVSYATVTFTGPFAAPLILQETFDSITPSTYNTLPVFGVPAVATRIGTGGSLVVRPWPGVPSTPNMMYGDGVDVRIKTSIPMRRFGGFFRSGVVGVFSSMATFVFYDASNTVIGSQSVPMTTSWQWVGFITNPKWKTVEIYGNVPGFAGAVAMDWLRMRPN